MSYGYFSVCDHCKKMEPATGTQVYGYSSPAVGWVGMVQYEKTGEQPDPLVFCSWACVANYADARYNSGEGE